MPDGHGVGITHCGADVLLRPERRVCPGEAEGTIGGVGFREGSFPVVIHVTDQTSHEGSVYGGPAASSTDAINALRAFKLGSSVSRPAIRRAPSL